MVKWVLALCALAVAGVVAIGAGWYFFIRDDDELATNAPDIPDELVEATSTPGGEPSGDTLAFVIIPEQSEAAYFVEEELASVGLPSTAKGATNEVEGTIYLTSDGALATGEQSQFTVTLTNLQSDEDRRDGRVQEALATNTFPTATFTVTSISDYDPSIPEGEEQTMTMTGTLDLHGVQKEVAWDVKARVQGNVITGLATLVVPFADFNITAPTFAGLVSIDDKATLQMQIVAEAA
jgi:polyisoprenoid-binding protein YceI